VAASKKHPNLVRSERVHQPARLAASKETPTSQEVSVTSRLFGCSNKSGNQDNQGRTGVFVHWPPLLVARQIGWRRRAFDQTQHLRYRHQQQSAQAKENQPVVVMGIGENPQLKRIPVQLNRTVAKIALRLEQIVDSKHPKFKTTKNQPWWFVQPVLAQ
jgi:hypothetical protein